MEKYFLLWGLLTLVGINTATAQQINFDEGDIIINEFMYDPPKEQAEYIELLNTTNKSFNIQGWRVDDSNDTPNVITTDEFILPPHGYVVISEDTAALYNAYGDRSYIQVGSFPSLNNSGDAFAIYTINGTKVDSVFYTPDWGGNEVALERRSATAPPVKANFDNSPNPSGGTPGMANQVAPDTTLPDFTDLVINDAQTLTLVFSERIQEASAKVETNYSLTNGITITTATPIAPDSIQLSLSSPLQNNVTYQVTVNNIADIFGNTTSANTSFIFYAPSPVDADDIYINEFMYDPPGGQTEYIELYNPTTKSLNLQGWTLTDDNSDNPATITISKIILPPDSYIVIAPNNTIQSENPNMKLITMGRDFPSLNNSGDAIVITNGSELKLDSLIYDDNWGGEAVALERRSVNAPPVQPNFGEAPNGFGTPGDMNEIPDDTAPPSLKNLIINDAQTLTLILTEPVQSQAATNLSNYKLTNSISISNALQLASDSVRLTLDSSLQNNTVYHLTVTNQQDIFGNKATFDTTFTYYVISAADNNDIYINEFMYDPPNGSAEYIELFNTTNKSLNIQGWTISDNTGDKHTITNARFILTPNSYVVIAPDQTLLGDYPDITLITMGSDFPSLNNSGDAIVITNATGAKLDSLRYNSSWGGDSTALERLTIQAASVKPNFKESLNGFGTPGSSNMVKNDTSPPRLISFSIINSQKLKLEFSELLQANPATNESNYSISRSLTIQSASLSNQSVELILSGPLKNNVDYTINARKISDIFGNKASVDTSFTFYKTSAVESGDIYITEFMYNPPSGQTEYIELYNPTNKSLNLQGWTVNDNSGEPVVITDQQYIIPPKSYVVLAPDETILSKNRDMFLITMKSNFPAFNNSGDNIVIRAPNGLLLDSLQYTSHWGGDEVALERRTVTAPPISANFKDSPNGLGSPGAKNMVELDTDPPKLNKAEVIDDSTILLHFTETIEQNTATNRSNYSFSPHVQIQHVTLNSRKVTLQLIKPLKSGQAYTLSIKNLKDIFGNTITAIREDIFFIKTSGAQKRDIVINEFLTNSEPEFIELYNRSDKNIDLSGWKIADKNNIAVINNGLSDNGRLPMQSAAQTVSIDHSLILQPDQYLIITASSSLAQKLNNGIYVSDLPSFNDDEDIIYIQNKANVTIDSLHYTTAFGSNIEGRSAERKDPNAASNDPANWTVSTSSTGYSSGKKNAIYQPDTKSPEIIFANLLPNNNVEVQFNEFIKITSELTFTINKKTSNIVSFNPSDGNKIILKSAHILTGKEMTITAANITDVTGNTTKLTQIPIAQLLTKGDVVINEILFDPINDSDDDLPDQSEYIELYNTRNYAISLESIYIHSAPNEDGKVDKLIPISTEAKWIPAKSIAIIYAGEVSTFSQTDIATFFDITGSPPRSLIRVDANSLGLSSSGDAIYLSTKKEVTIDSVVYKDSWHNPNIIDTEGIALERINPKGKSNNPNNWGSSTAQKGGTPAADNTLYQPMRPQKTETGMSFSTNPFSPDGDGFEDNLIIHYKLKNPNYLMTVKIYDRYGRFIIELADSKPAGTEGTIIWNGRKENGTRNRIGIYIVVFRAFDSSNGKEMAFKKTVVIARRLH